jgi:hypothetical protein
MGKYHYFFEIDLFLNKINGGTKIADEKKGHIKITIEAEINEALMEMLKEGMTNIPHMMQQMMPGGKKE